LKDVGKKVFSGKEQDYHRKPSRENKPELNQIYIYVKSESQFIAVL